MVLVQQRRTLVASILLLEVKTIEFFIKRLLLVLMDIRGTCFTIMSAENGFLKTVEIHGQLSGHLTVIHWVRYNLYHISGVFRVDMKRVIKAMDYRRTQWQLMLIARLNLMVSYCLLNSVHGRFIFKVDSARLDSMTAKLMLIVQQLILKQQTSHVLVRTDILIQLINQMVKCAMIKGRDCERPHL